MSTFFAKTSWKKFKEELAYILVSSSISIYFSWSNTGFHAIHSFT